MLNVNKYLQELEQGAEIERYRQTKSREAAKLLRGEIPSIKEQLKPPPEILTEKHFNLQDRVIKILKNSILLTPNDITSALKLISETLGYEDFLTVSKKFIDDYSKEKLTLAEFKIYLNKFYRDFKKDINLMTLKPVSSPIEEKEEEKGDEGLEELERVVKSIEDLERGGEKFYLKDKLDRYQNAYLDYYDKEIRGNNRKKITISKAAGKKAIIGYIILFSNILPSLNEIIEMENSNIPKLLDYIEQDIGDNTRRLEEIGLGIKGGCYDCSSNGKKKNGKKKRIVLGYGIRVDEPYKFLPFGNYVIPKKLLDKNYFSLRYPERTKKQVEYFTNKLITPNFRNLILEITINKTPLDKIKHLYDDLDDDEKELFDNALSFSKLTSKEGQDYYRHKTLNDKQKTNIIARFKLLRGSLMAGNNSDEVIKELKIILLKMISNKMISQKDASDMMIYLISV